MSKKYASKAKPQANPKNYYLLPLAMVFMLLPFISYLHFYDSKLSSFSWFPDSSQTSDMYLYGKSIFFIVMSSCMLIQIIVDLVQKKVKRIPLIYLPLAAYALLSLLSAVFSQYRSFSFAGGFEQFESVWVLLGYCITALYAYHMVKEEANLHFLFNFLVVGILMSVLLGLGQSVGYNFWGSSLGQMLRIPDANLRASVELSYTFESGRVYMSLYNPNYVGLYAALLLPLLICLLCSIEKKNYFFDLFSPIYPRVLLVFLIGALLFCTVRSRSANGYIAIAVAAFFTLLFLLSRNRKHWYLVPASMIALIAVFFLANFISGQKLTNRLAEEFNLQKTTTNLQDIEFQGDQVTLTYRGNKLNLLLSESGEFFISDETGTTPEMTTLDNGNYSITDERFQGIEVLFSLNDNKLSVGFIINNHTWLFCNIDGDIKYLSTANKWCTFESAPSALLTGYEALMSGRGYIWSRTLPLLKDHIFLGSGPDTFTVTFPNDDYVAKSTSAFHSSIITRPHSMYLQTAVQTGVLSLIAVLVFYIWYFISSCRLYFTHPLNSYLAKTGFGIWIGTIGYMLSSVVNDSTITVAPLFWGLTGLGICINKKLLPMSEKSK